ncbi:MAG: hypothetical protein M0030_13295 [Actinomycetota bacterium]|nr:hypothetical protein [Actinomycetota bacterium]
MLVTDGGRRRALHDKISRFVQHSDDGTGRWAAVMLNADAYPGHPAAPPGRPRAAP